MISENWITFGGEEAPLAFRRFEAHKGESASVSISGLGFFLLYLNGKEVSPDRFVPAWTDYHPRYNRRLLYPISDTFTHRVLWLDYDLTGLIREGENELSVLLGNGWYGQNRRNIEGDFRYGSPKLSFVLTVGGKTIVSDESVMWKPSEITFNNIYYGEKQDLRRLKSDVFLPAKRCPAPEGIIEKQTCPPDRVIRTVEPKALKKEGNRVLYDCGENITGVPRFLLTAKEGEEVVCRFAEEIFEDGRLFYQFTGGEGQIQSFSVISDGENREVFPKFGLFGFRYFEVIGDAEDVKVDVIHSDIRLTASFHSSDEGLNWLFDAYVRTQENNMHWGTVSDCPHRERLGYTGDGQLTCDTAMLLFDSEALYRKWIRDIADSQDPVTGHVQHTAPFYGGGGGPGGWGGAMVIVPYRFYRHFGDKEFVKTYLPNMKKFLSYLRSHSEDGIVVREEEHGWCLGDWCTPEPIKLPEPLVNTYYRIKCLEYTAFLSEEVGEDGSALREEAQAVREAFVRHFFDPGKNTFGMQGADAFALDLGLGNEALYEEFREQYAEENRFDTGIFGTDLVVKVLCAHGDLKIALSLLTSEKYGSFGYERARGATTLWEDWNGLTSRDHPMFGACVRHLFYSLLGIDPFGETLTAHPAVGALPSFSGSVLTKKGRITVSVEGEKAEVTVS